MSQTWNQTWKQTVEPMGHRGEGDRLMRKQRVTTVGVRRPLPTFSALLAVLAVAGCGVPDTGPVTAGAPAAGGPATGRADMLRAYFVTPNGTWPAARPAPPGAGPQEALDALLSGPTRSERARGLDTALPDGPHRVRARGAPGTVDLYLPWVVAELDGTAVSQLVCTATAAPGIPGGGKSVDVIVRIHESGLPGSPWAVRCDETGMAAPVGTSEEKGQHP